MSPYFTFKQYQLGVIKYIDISPNNSVVFTKIHNHRQIQLHEEYKQYLIIGKQLYMIDMDGQLILCVWKNDYIQVLNYVHVRVGSSHFSGCSIGSQIIY